VGDCCCGNTEGTNKECERCRMIARIGQLEDDNFELKAYRTRYWAERGCCRNCGGMLDGHGAICEWCRRSDAMERGDYLRDRAKDEKQ
jgi:hypothetical protein